MNTEFDVWLLIVGLVVGTGLVWLVMLDSRRRETEVDAVERPREARWLSAILADDGYDVSPEAAARLLMLHRVYLDAPPPDGAMTGLSMFTNETPNRAPAPMPEMAGAGPTQ